LMGGGDEAVARAGVRLAGLWKVGMARERLKAILVADEGSDALLRDVAVALGGFRGPGQGEVFREMIQEGVSGRTARMAVIGALTMNPKVGAEMAAEVLAGLEDARESGALITALLANKQTPKLLAQALNGKTIPQGVARQLVQKAQSSGMQVDALVAAVKKAGNLKPMVQQLSPEAMAAMVGLVRTEGDAHRGEKVYRRVEMQCAVCHAIGETGGLVGPNLVSLGASAPEDYLIESMLEPSKKVKEGYHMTMVTTKGGDIFSGGLVSESGQEIVIRDAAGLERVIPTGDVAQKQTSPVSMMPPGLTVSLREDEFIDLIRFLSELGKEGDFKTPPNRYVRHWEVVVPTLDIGHDMGFYGLPFFTRADAELDWRPVSSTVAGYLEGAEMPTISGRLKGRPGKVTFGVGRFFLEGEAGAKAVLGLENAEGVSLVVNGEEIEGAERIEVEVVDGKTPVVVVVNKEAAGTPVRIELLDSGGEVKLASRPVP
jgi:putative heme-binding domain-containing protein